MVTTATTSRFGDLLALRAAVARLGESDAFAWWRSHALTEAGEYALPRIFRRAPTLAAVHLSLMAARLRHDEAMPKEPVVHLFNLGEAFEGAFERWLIERKAEGWTPELRTARPTGTVADALREAGIEPGSERADGDRILLGSLRPPDLENATSRRRIATRLAAAYAASDRGRLVVPYFRVES